MRHRALKIFRREALFIGVGLTLFQILMALWLAPGKSVSEAYQHLCAWDCGWYEEIAHDGYHSPVPPVGQRRDVSNVAFFPGYPYLGRALYLSTGIPPKLGLLIIAQIFCVLFWATLWSALMRWKIPRPLAWLVILAVLAHPASFFLVAGYSESLFLFTLLLFVMSVPPYPSRTFSSDEKRKWPSRAGYLAQTKQASAALAGFLMSATRIVGIPVAACPLFVEFSGVLTRRRGPSIRKMLPAALVSLAAAGGALFFFAYCRIRFGDSTLYMDTQKAGWGIQPDYRAIFEWGSFDYAHPWDRVATLASGMGFAFLILLEAALWKLRKATGLTRRAPLYLAAFMIFFITISGLKTQSFKSMIRYTLPWTILLIICLAHLTLRFPRPPKPAIRIGYALLVLGLLLLFWYVEIPHFRDFLHDQWFA